MAEAAGWLLTYLLHSTLVLGGSWLLVRTGRVRSPAARDLLWKVALLAGLVTSTAGVLARERARGLGSPADWTLRPLELAPDTRELRSTSPLGVPHRTRRLRMRARVADPSPACRAALRPAGVGPGWIDAVDAACAAPAGVRWFHGLMFLWIAGAGVGLVRLGAARRSLRRALRPLHPASADARCEMERLRAGAGLPTVRLVRSAVLDTPAVLDGRTIGLPSGPGRELDRTTLRAALAHEAGHLARRDPFWLAVVRSVTAVFWIQPLNRLACRGFEEAAEHACDDWAVARTREPLALARSIALVAGWTLPGGRRVALAMARAGSTSVTRRVRRILAGTPEPTPGRWRLAALAATVVAPVALVPSVSTPLASDALIVVREEVRLEAGGPYRGLDGEDTPPGGTEEGRRRVEVLVRTLRLR